MNIRRKIYYDLLTGNVIIHVREQRNVYNVRETTIEEDIQTFTELSSRNRDTFDVMVLEVGQYQQDFVESIGFRVNPDTKELEFSYPDPNAPEEPQAYQKPLSEQIKALELQQKQLNDDFLDFIEFNLGGI